MKKLVNDVHDVVTESLEGFALAHEDLITVHFNPAYVTRATPKSNGKVGLVSGGGSGHEPLHAGYVGFGMLDAAVPGPVFTSPTPDAILEATRVADRGAGVLHVVKNYTGDLLNFETAAELADSEGIRVSTVIVNDDVAVENSGDTVGRRGLAGTILVEKIAGAAAERGDTLDEVCALARTVTTHMRSMGLALGPCTVPHADAPSFTLGDDEIEVGIGIHGEPGYRRGTLEAADALMAELYARIRDDLALTDTERVITLVNGLGATPMSELYICHRRLVRLLGADGIQVERSLVGNYVTSLEMPGVSLTLLRVDDELLDLFDAPVMTPAWK